MQRRHSLSIHLGERIKISTKGVPSLVRRRIYETLVFVNPVFQKRHAEGQWLGNIQSRISCMEENHQNFFIPRGFLYQLQGLCDGFRVHYRVIDHRAKFEAVEFEFHGKLKHYQEHAVNEVLKKDFGILVGGPKTGKKIIALNYLTRRHCPTLIIAPYENVVDDWCRKIKTFLQLDPGEIGIISGKSYHVGRKITVAHTNALFNLKKRLRNRFGLVIIDDCNYCSGRFFTTIMPTLNSMYTLGLAGSTCRKDGLSRLMYFYIGDIVHTIDKAKALEDKSLVRAEVKIRETPFNFPYSCQEDFPALMESLMQDERRVDIIVQDIMEELHRGSVPMLVLSGGNVQTKNISEKLRANNVKFESIRMGCEAEAFREIAEKFKGGEIDVLLAPVDTIKKGLKPGNVRSLFLVTPTYFRDELAEFLKELDSKTSQNRVKIYDYVDTRVGILKNFFRIRSYSYGIKLQGGFLEP